MLVFVTLLGLVLLSSRVVDQLAKGVITGVGFGIGRTAVEHVIGAISPTPTPDVNPSPAPAPAPAPTPPRTIALR